MSIDDRKREINAVMRADSKHIEAAAAAMVKLLEYGVPVDVQQLLVSGSKQAGVRPGALVAALSAAIGVYQRF